jgi:hypothetical protein
MTVVLVHGNPETEAIWAPLRAELDGLGHWWMLQDPARSAEMLTEFCDGGDREALGAVGKRLDADMVGGNEPYP